MDALSRRTCVQRSDDPARRELLLRLVALPLFSGLDAHTLSDLADTMEWLVLPQMFALTGSALEKAAWLGENLVVDAERMRANVAASGGLMLAEAISYALAPYTGLAAAKQTVSEAARQAAVDGRHLLDILHEQSKAPLDWESLREEANYLGASETFIDEVIQAAARI